MRPAYPRQFDRRNLCRLFVACGIVVIALSAGASTAQATCGDYLMDSRSSDHVAGHHASILHDQLGSNGDAIVPVRPACPCRGLSCKADPGKAPLPIPSVQVENQDEMIGSVVLQVPSLDNCLELSRFSEPVALPTIAYRLDRPPKA